MISWELIIEQLDWGTWELDVLGLKLEILAPFSLIALTILFVSIFIYRLNSHPKQRVKRLQQQKVRKKWLELYPIHATPYEQIAFLSILLRRIATQIYGQACNGLNGDDWLAWLTKKDPQVFDWTETGRILIELPSMPKDFSIEKEQVDVIYQAVLAWVKC